MIVDTHTHIYEPEFDEDINDVTRRAKEAGVRMMVLPNIGLGSIPRLKQLLESDRETFVGAMGLHPEEVKENWKEVLAEIKKEAYSGGYTAIGEIGLDYYRDKTYKEEQKEAFREQLDWAREKDFPVLIHCRKAYDDAIKTVKESGVRKGVFHCFGGTVQEAERVFELGDFYIGIGGVVTFKNSSMAEVVKSVDISRIVAETDAPYLAPAPHRGKRNEPSYITDVIKKIAELKQKSFEETSKITSENAFNLLKMLTLPN